MQRPAWRRGRAAAESAAFDQHKNGGLVDGGGRGKDGVERRDPPYPGVPQGRRVERCSRPKGEPLYCRARRLQLEDSRARADGADHAPGCDARIHGVRRERQAIRGTLPGQHAGSSMPKPTPQPAFSRSRVNVSM